jgi:tetratricopeptide (TPR) repeat protein
MVEQSGNRAVNTAGTVHGSLVQADLILGDINFHDTPALPLEQRAFLADLTLPNRFPPSALLRSEYKIVPFHGRESELADLVSWCGTDEPVGIRLCTGPGGQGKTRLALEAVAALAQQGWTAGRLSTDCDERTLRELCALPADVLLVVDYAESRPTQLGRLLEVAGARPTAGTGRLRLLLLARSAVQWWPQRRAAMTDDGIAALMDGAEYALVPLFDDPADRPRLFAQALQEFADRGGWQSAGLAPPDDLTHQRFASALGLHMAALAALLDHQDAVAERALRQFREAPEANVPAEAGLHSALAEGLESANRFDEALEHFREAVRLFKKIVREKPDRYSYGYLRALCNYASQLDNSGQHDEALKTCNEALAEAERYGTDDGYLRANIWWCRSEARKHRRKPAKAATAMEQAVAECRAAAETDERARGHLPLMLMNLANRYSDLGRHDDALETIEESVALYRRREHMAPDPLNPSFGQILHNYSACLYDCDRPQEGRAAIAEAARRLVQVTEHHTPRLPMLWGALEVWGMRLHTSDFADEAVRAEYEELATLHTRTDWPRDGRRGQVAVLFMLDYWIRLGEYGDQEKAKEWRRNLFALFPREANLLWRSANASARRSWTDRRT